MQLLAGLHQLHGLLCFVWHALTTGHSLFQLRVWVHLSSPMTGRTLTARETSRSRSRAQDRDRASPGQKHHIQQLH
jgi:hypothetical protein